MEALNRVKAVVMDKTGTLTKGVFHVQQIGGGLDVLQLCASCEQHSTHPIAQSITAAARAKNITLSNPDAVEEIPGKGIRATVDGQAVLCGSEILLRENGITFDPVDFPGSVVYMAADGGYLGFVTVSDTLKEGAKTAVARLKAAGVTPAMLTGDNETSAKGVSRELGIDRVHARLLPHEKLERLRAIREEVGAAMFVGDGINDAPVLAGADVGAAMGTGADAAIEAADVVFLTRDVEAIPEALSIARRTNSIAMSNVVFALSIKALVMLLGLLGRASMWLAVFADSGVAVICVLNAIRLLYRKK
jgi:Cd2+/Zn2+-exporting ATPase